MKNILDYPAFHIAIPVIISIVINGIIYSQGWSKNKQKNIKNPLIPPGYFIGPIWIFIFALLGYAHYLYNK
jgi:tryptophan-rich sensory protein